MQQLTEDKEDIETENGQTQDTRPREEGEDGGRGEKGKGIVKVDREDEKNGEKEGKDGGKGEIVAKDGGTAEVKNRGEKGDTKEEGGRGGETMVEMEDDILLFIPASPRCPSSLERYDVTSPPSEQPASAMLQSGSESWCQDLGGGTAGDCLRAEPASVSSDSEAAEDRWADCKLCDSSNHQEISGRIPDVICDGGSEEEEKEGEHESSRRKKEDEAALEGGVEEQREAEVDDEEDMRSGGRNDVEDQMKSSWTAGPPDPDGGVRVSLSSLLSEHLTWPKVNYPQVVITNVNSSETFWIQEKRFFSDLLLLLIV